MKLIIENYTADDVAYNIINQLSKINGIITVGASDADRSNRVNIQMELRGKYETFSPMGRKHYGEFIQDVRRLKSEVVKLLKKHNAILISWDSPIKKYWKSNIDGKREGGYDTNSVYLEIAIKITETTNPVKSSKINELTVTNIPNFNLESDVYIATLSIVKNMNSYKKSTIKYGKILYDRISAGHSSRDAIKFIFPMLSSAYMKFITPEIIIRVVAIINKRSKKLNINTELASNSDIIRRFSGILAIGTFDSLISDPLDWSLIKSLNDKTLTDLANNHSVERGKLKMGGIMNRSLSEGRFSEIDMMANDAGSFEQFVKEFYIEYKEFPKDKETLKWLKSIYQNRSGK